MPVHTVYTTIVRYIGKIIYYTQPTVIDNKPTFIVVSAKTITFEKPIPVEEYEGLKHGKEKNKNEKTAVAVLLPE